MSTLINHRSSMVRPPPVVTTCRGLAGREHTDQPPVEQGETSPASPLGRGLAGREHTDQPPVGNIVETSAVVATCLVEASPVVSTLINHRSSMVRPHQAWLLVEASPVVSTLINHRSSFVETFSSRPRHTYSVR